MHSMLHLGVRQQKPKGLLLKLPEIDVHKPGYRSVVVDAAMTVDTRLLICAKVGFSTCNRSTAILSSAVLSRTTTASAFCVRRFRVSSEL